MDNARAHGPRGGELLDDGKVPPMSLPQPARNGDLDLSVRAGKPPIVHVVSHDPEGWVAEHRGALHEVVAEHGAVLVRGLGLADPRSAAGVSRRLTSTLLTERERFAPRDTYEANIYSSSKWPSDRPMCMHHELSYTLEPPSLIVFTCLVAPAEGGATGLADAQAVLRELPSDLVDRFLREGWQLVRNYSEAIGLPWSDVFGGGERAVVERYCRDNGIELRWRADGSLHTRQRRSAIVHHPVTREPCWFNQIAFLNEWTMEPEVRAYLLSELGQNGLPFNSLFGDGQSIGQEVVQFLNDAYERCTLREPWQEGDLMLVDNIRMAHSREPYNGAREVVVALGDPVGLESCKSTVHL